MLSKPSTFAESCFIIRGYLCTRLSGFAITAAPTSGIGVDARNANDVAIQNNQITNVQNFGIFYGADSGGTFNNVTIENNSISNVATYDGIFAGVSGGSTLNNLVIRNNQINTATRDGIGVGAGNNSQLNQATITKNQVTNTGRFGIGAGIDTPNISPPVITLLNSDGSTLSVAITNNTITNSGTNGSSPFPSGSVGIATQDANSRVCFELSGNTSTSPASPGLPYSASLDLFLINQAGLPGPNAANFQIAGRDSLNALNNGTFDVVNMFINPVTPAALNDTNSTAVASCP